MSPDLFSTTLHGEPALAAPDPKPRLLSLTGIRALLTIYNLELWMALCILVVGFALRITPRAVPHTQTIDEHLYEANVAMLQTVGLLEYPSIVENYVTLQSRKTEVMLPPTRCLFVICGYGWASLFGSDTRDSLQGVAETFSLLSFLLAGLCAARMGGSRYGLAVLALMAVAPVELQMAHCALVDGFFAFWALLCFWLLWENLQHPRRPGFLAAYVAAIAAMVMTKENSFFAFVGMSAALALARPLKIGTVNRETVLATFAGAIIGVSMLILISGGLGTFIETYRLLVTKAEQMGFAYATGGGPWYRYIVDLLLMSPVVTLPAIAAVFNLRREDKPAVYLLILVAFSYLIMTNVKNGMNLRYATMWDMPLRYLAAGQLFRTASVVRRAPQLVAVALIALVAVLELQQYCTFFVSHDIGELVTAYLMRALEIVRTAK